MAAWPMVRRSIRQYLNRQLANPSIDQTCGYLIMLLALDQTDNGNCRVYYRDEGKRLLCFQEAGRGRFELFRCSRDGEPDHDIKHDAVTINSLPTDDSSTANAFRLWAGTSVQISKRE